MRYWRNDNHSLIIFLRRHYPDQVQGTVRSDILHISAGLASSAPVFDCLRSELFYTTCRSLVKARWKNGTDDEIAACWGREKEQICHGTESIPAGGLSGHGSAVLRHGAHGLHREYDPRQLDAWAPPEGVDLAAWNESFSAHLTLVAVEGGAIVGFGDMAPDGYLDRLYVAGTHLRRGGGLRPVRRP